MTRYTWLATSLALALPLAATPARAGTAGSGDGVPPGIRLWTTHGDTYHRGEPVRIFFRTERDAYVTIFRVDTDGRLRVLFPHEPTDPNLARGGETYDVEGVNDQDAFYVDDYPGVGYVFGVASEDPFAYDPMVSNEHWDFAAAQNLTDGRLHADPYASLQQLVQQIEPEGYADYDTHLLPYYVDQRYDYPRFLCYDCHTYMPYTAWNPYAQFCSRFSLFVTYDPFYYYPSYWYPTRYYGGTAVVYVRPRFAGSQYVFREPGARSAATIVYRNRNTGLPSTPQPRGVRGVDLGGVGSVPAPVGGGRRMAGGVNPVQSPGGVPVGRPAASGGGDQHGQAASGRRYVPVTDLGVIGPSRQPSASEPQPAASEGGRRYIGGAAASRPGQVSPEAPRERGIYIDPGDRPQAESPASRPVAEGRYIREGSGTSPRGQVEVPARREAGSAGPAPRAEAPRGYAPAAPRAEAPRAVARPAGRSSGTPTLIRRRP